MPWLTRAMALNPTAPEPHQYVARCLAASGQGALARREYRLAVLYGSHAADGSAVSLGSFLKNEKTMLTPNAEPLF